MVIGLVAVFALFQACGWLIWCCVGVLDAVRCGDEGGGDDFGLITGGEEIYLV